MTRISLVFPGQGSQKPGMGQPWVGTSSWDIAQQAREVSGIDVPGLLCDADADTLKQTLESQLTTLTLSLIAYDHVRRVGLFDGHEVLVHAGHSLGEYSALAAAGAIDVADAVRVVTTRGTAMADAARAEPGAMAAIVGIATDTLRALLDEIGQCWMANDNGAGQYVVSGRPDAVAEAADRARAAGAILSSMLPVGGAFHSPLMRPAAQALDTALRRTVFRDSDVPVYSAVDAEGHTAATDFAALLAQQLTGPVRWREVSARLAAHSDVLVEVGPGKVLTRLARREYPDLTLFALNQPGELTAIRAELSAKERTADSAGV